MKKIYIIWTLIIVLLISVIIFMGFSIINKNKEYKNLENDMEKIVANYLGQHIEKYPKKGEKRINITDVINEGYEIDMFINNDKCNGYVVVKKVSIAYQYDGYISCSNYTTKGYSK